MTPDIRDELAIPADRERGLDILIGGRLVATVRPRRVGGGYDGWFWDIRDWSVRGAVEQAPTREDAVRDCLAHLRAERCTGRLGEVYPVSDRGRR